MDKKNTLLGRYDIISNLSKPPISGGDYSLLVGSLLIGGMLNHDANRSFGTRQFSIATRTVADAFESRIVKLLTTDPEVYIPGYAAEYARSFSDLLSYLRDPRSVEKQLQVSNLDITKVPMAVNLANTALSANSDVTATVIGFGSRSLVNLEQALKGRRNLHDLHHAEYWAIWNATKGK